MEAINNASIKISVIIPVYNAEKYLQQCLDSVLFQSLNEIEVICIDDCSNDSSYDILQDYSARDERVIVLKNTTNMHAGSCRNKGIEIARGEYLRFLDADDYMAEDALRKEYNTAVEHNLDFIKTAAFDIDAITGEYNNNLSHDSLQFFPSELFDVITNFRENPLAFRRVAVVPWNGIYKRTFIMQNNIRFNTLKCVNDRSFYVAVLTFARRVMVSNIEAVYHRTNNPDSLVGKRFVNFDCHFKSYECILNISSGLPDILKYRIMDSELSDICNWFNRIGNWDIFQKLFSETKDFFDSVDITFMLKKTEELGENLENKIWNKVYHDIMALTPEQYIMQNKIKMHRIRETKHYDTKISVIIPVYNMEQYLDACLDSMLYQTLEEIEVICVDDCSTDGSVRLLERRAEDDYRVKIIRHETNQSASQCRKDGVMASNGKYIMFVDADDALKPSAFENLYNEMEADPVDILHFNAEIINEGNLSQARIDNMKKFVAPYGERIKGFDVLEKCFSSKEYRFSLWNKIYDSSLCKLAFSNIKDGNFPKAQDMYAYFVLAFYAESYRGIPDQTYYEYHFGRGGTGHNKLNMEQFERYCKMGLVADAIRDFLEERQALGAFENSYDILRRDLVNDCVSQWDKYIDSTYKVKGLDLMLDFFESHEIVAKAVDFNSATQGELAKIALKARSFETKKRRIKTIGMHYFRLSNGGVQRVISLLSSLFDKMGYEVVIFCEEEPSENDYDLPEGVKVVVLPNIKTSFKTIRKHLSAFYAEIINYNVDIMIDHAWVDYYGLLAHMLTVKSLGIPFVIHCHNIYTAPLLKSGLFFADMPYIYSLADHVVALSNTDKEYWQQFNDNVTVVANPLTFDLNSIAPVSLDSKNIIWIARVSSEKKPYDAVNIFKSVAEQEPDAKMYLVGSSKKDSEMEDLKNYIVSKGLEDKIIVTGFVRDVETYYNNSSVFISTSLYEGFPMTLLEAQSFGIPTVMYELPWLTITENGQGIITVPQGDIQQAAYEIVKLLNDDDMRIRMGKTARDNIERIAAFDYIGTWGKIIESAANSHDIKKNEKSKETMFTVMYSHYRSHILDIKGYIKPNDKIRISTKEWLTVDDIVKTLGWNRNDRKRLAEENKSLLETVNARKDYTQIKSEREEYLREINNIRASFTFKIGRFITWLPRKIRDLFRKG